MAINTRVQNYANKMESLRRKQEMYKKLKEELNTNNVFIRAYMTLYLIIKICIRLFNFPINEDHLIIYIFVLHRIHSMYYSLMILHYKCLMDIERDSLFVKQLEKVKSLTSISKIKSINSNSKEIRKRRMSVSFSPILEEEKRPKVSTDRPKTPTSAFNEVASIKQIDKIDESDSSEFSDSYSDNSWNETKNSNDKDKQD